MKLTTKMFQCLPSEITKTSMTPTENTKKNKKQKNNNNNNNNDNNNSEDIDGNNDHSIKN